MDIFGPTTSLKIRKLNNYRHGFKCNTCDYKTADKGNLKRQKKSVHDGVKKFQCKTFVIIKLQKKIN